MPQSLTDIQALLQAHDLRPKHKWGQNFLHDHHHMQHIVETARLQPEDLVLEVGAGTGSLSEQLLESGAKLLAVEIDRDLEPILHQRLDPFGAGVALHIGDVMANKRHLDPAVLAKMQALAMEHSTGADLRFAAKQAHDMSDVASPFDTRHQPSDISPSPKPTPRPPAFKLIANLPYGVASPLISTLALAHPEMKSAVVMVQREVADRLTAEPGGKPYGPLGIVVQAMGAVRRVANLPAECFWPKPKVGSAVVRFDRFPEPLATNPEALTSLVQTLFMKRRKQLGSILGREISWPVGIEPSMRPEQLSVEQLVALAEIIGDSEPSPR